MALSCDRTWKDYLRVLVQLLPPGYAWEWGADSVGRHFLASISDELARVHQFYCNVVQWGISQFTSEITGWSAPEYELLLLNRFGIEAVVSDGLQPTDCEMSCESPLLDEYAPFVFLITVDDLSVFTDEVIAYLNSYKQSHTVFHLRDRAVNLVTLADVAATDCEDPCDIALYEKPYHLVELQADWTWRFEDFTTLMGWVGIASQLRDNTHIRRSYV